MMTVNENHCNFTDEQVTELQKAIQPGRVSKDGKGFSHVEAWDVRRTMNKIFGFGEWSLHSEEMQLVFEVEVDNPKQPSKKRWSVGYRCRATLTIGSSSYSEWAAGDALNPVRGDAHDMAIKTAESQAFKRCAVNLGDQFGLSLYNNGSLKATVGDVVGQVHEDDEKKESFIKAFQAALTQDDLNDLGAEISDCDLGTSTRESLRLAYHAAAERIRSNSEN
jgi:recombination DNA repair RAD52 pathway protein